jgi:predicted metalloprotease with PDZ domain
MRHFVLCLATLCLASWTGVQPALASNGSPILLEVDASHAPQLIFHVRQVIPAEPGPLTLYYPKWIPGWHAPAGPIADVAGLKLHADGKPVRWRRDELDMYAFHCTVPQGAHALDVEFDLLNSNHPSFGDVDATENIAGIRWSQVLLYPKGKPIEAIDFQASLKLPDGWKLGTALPIESQDGATTRFGTVSLETLVDSPVIAGRYFREIRLGKVEPPHYLDLACDSAAGLEITPKQKAGLTKLVVEAGAMFGVRHYKDYHFLIALSDKLPGRGIEHHECSDNVLPERALSSDEKGKAIAYLLPHEYAHSWCGKYRRPKPLVTPTFQETNDPRLLWVYEGLTEYLGPLLTARSGLLTNEEARERLAYTSQLMENRTGRSWRPLEDTTFIGPMLGYSASGWTAWRRSSDYYEEGTLIWLLVDTKIRQLTNGQKSLDDFCRRFFGGPGGKAEVKPYEFDDVIADLNAIAPYDWKSLWTSHLTETSEHAPLEGIEQSGWRLTLSGKPTGFEKATEALRKFVDAASSVGMTINPEGSIIDVIVGKPAFRAGVAPGMKLVAVNMRKFTPEVLEESLVASQKPDQPISLLVDNGDFFKVFTLDYHDGPRHPHLERLKDQPDLLSKIFAPLTGGGETKSPAVSKAAD